MLQRKLGQTLPPAEPIWPAVIFYIAVYVLAAAAEEVGWTGYALEPLRQRYGLLGAGLLLGAVWWLWHALPFLMMGHGPALMFWTAVGTVAHRVLMTLLYDRTNGGVPSAVIYHTMINVTYSLYPVQGSHYDYRIVGVLLVLLCSLGALLPRQNHVPVRGVPS
ncbi:hypothetical protein GCM10017783_06520 [Deinococcus piscis]|uniref:CAAX prenyl protease 2/Lysostaphin resistance protein A-like domain-containing protein n=2 Tax=Deinococcus piscis TaxID=394230 RepID=A0ABQ3K3A7_9DEIO|nr:hypothetical protein GCM10017783_06520 [Deinococcus piscis]